MLATNIEVHLPPFYSGKSVNCHVQALATAYSSVFANIDTWLLDVLTSVPFGVIYRENDPSRLLDCYLDPDIGLDRALSTLHLSFETVWWNADVDSAIPFRQLETWSTAGPVLLGPLDMGYLPYLFHPEIYHDIDHYVVVTGVEQDWVWLCDPEGVPCAKAKGEELFTAWRASSVPEGRGTYMMRRIVSPVSCKCDVYTLACALRYAARNLQDAQEQPNGGMHCMIAIAEEEKRIMNDPSLRQGLKYVLSAKSQRSLSGARFLQMLSAMPSVPLPAALISEGIIILQEQANLCGDILSVLTKAMPSPLQGLRQVGFLEKRLTDVFIALARSIS